MLKYAKWMQIFLKVYDSIENTENNVSEFSVLLESERKNAKLTKKLKI